MKTWKIYTKTGDKGETSLLGGKRVQKNHLKIEAYGTVDELNSFVGLLMDQEMEQGYRDVLERIQSQLFVAESLLATDEGSEKYPLPVLQPNDITMLENEIDEMNKHLPSLSHFILPGGNQSVSLAHVCRTICRRAERVIVGLANETQVDDVIIQYFNRLSDYFFVLARKLGYDAGLTDRLWVPAKESK